VPRIVRIIPSICSIGMGDLGFFGIGERLFRNFLGEKVLLEWSDVSAFASAMASRDGATCLRRTSAFAEASGVTCLRRTTAWQARRHGKQDGEGKRKWEVRTERLGGAT
jgi:hypothetical protein